MARHNAVTKEQFDEIVRLYRTTSLTMEDIGKQIGVGYHGVYNVITTAFSTEERAVRKKKVTYSNSKKGIKNPQFGKKRSPRYALIDENPMYKHYVEVHRPSWYTGRKGKSSVYEHSIVACINCGWTNIPKGLVVHHCDYDGSNNDWGNLCVMTLADHAALHRWLEFEGATTISKESTAKWLEARRQGKTLSLHDIV